jgi:hypothetical protein
VVYAFPAMPGWEAMAQAAVQGIEPLGVAKDNPLSLPALPGEDPHFDDAILALITRTTYRTGLEPAQLLIDSAKLEGRQTDLLHMCAIKYEHLMR